MSSNAGTGSWKDKAGPRGEESKREYQRAAKRKWEQEHREERTARERVRYASHAEEINARRRELRRLKKLESFGPVPSKDDPAALIEYARRVIKGQGGQVGDDYEDVLHEVIVELLDVGAVKDMHLTTASAKGHQWFTYNRQDWEYSKEADRDGCSNCFAPGSHDGPCPFSRYRCSLCRYEEEMEERVRCPKCNGLMVMIL